MAQVAWILCEGTEITTREIAQQIGLHRKSVYHMMSKLVQVLPITRDGHGKWKKSDRINRQQLAGNDQQSPRSRATRGKGAVYLIRAENGLCKIGRACNAEARFRGLQTMSPIPLKLIHLILNGKTAKVERLLHKRFASSRHHGEWFALNDADVEFVCGLTADNAIGILE